MIDEENGYQALLDRMDDRLYQEFKSAVEIGRWSNGAALTQSQREACLQAMIYFEIKYLPEEQRTGYMADQCSKDNSQSEVSLLQIIDQKSQGH